MRRIAETVINEVTILIYLVLFSKCFKRVNCNLSGKSNACVKMCKMHFSYGFVTFQLLSNLYKAHIY